MSDAQTGIGGAALRLSKNVLGIIALFIVLVSGFFGLIVVNSESFSPEERLLLISFVSIFAILVLGVFAWLAISRPGVFLDPKVFTDQRLWLLAIGIPYGKAGFDNRSPIAEAPQPASEPPMKNASGNSFWLGHDLMWTADVLLRHGPSKEILIGLDQARHHLEQVGLGRNKISTELSALSESIQTSDESSLTPEIRDQYASQLGSIIDRLGMMAERSQVNFSLPPHWGRTRS